MSLGNLIWVFTLCSNLSPCLFTPFSPPHPEHCIFSAQIQSTPLDELFCCHDQWVTLSLVYRLSAVSREESWPQEKLCQDKWDYQPDPSHCYSTWASRLTEEEQLAMGSQPKRKVRCSYFAIFKYNFKDRAWYSVEISPHCPVVCQLEDRHEKACSADWDRVVVPAGQPPRVTAPPCPPQPQTDVEIGRAEQAPVSFLYQQK